MCGQGRSGGTTQLSCHRDPSCSTTVPAQAGAWGATIPMPVQGGELKSVAGIPV